ncbi:MAG: biotin transporter BioY [Lachnospiraceae bacterium]|nr:biotin transporter BioY [Lachnospiraceae bacterium]
MESGSKVKKMCYVALATAIICVLGPLSVNIPVSPVPISLAILGIYIAAYALSAKWGTVACIIYILIGLAGVPVLAGYTGGPQKLFGPTGGYMIGYIAVAFFTGFFIEKFENKFYMHAVGMVIGLAICYTLGTVWLARVAGMSFGAALAAGVIPFIPMDIVKMVIAVAVGVPLRKALKRVIYSEKGYQGLSG